MMYVMTTRMGSVVIKKQAKNLEEAITFFSKMKRLSRKEFLKIFLVTKIKNYNKNETI